jgi:hypothetical protein
MLKPLRDLVLRRRKFSASIRLPTRLASQSLWNAPTQFKQVSRRVPGNPVYRIPHSRPHAVFSSTPAVGQFESSNHDDLTVERNPMRTRAARSVGARVHGMVLSLARGRGLCSSHHGAGHESGAHSGENRSAVFGWAIRSDVGRQNRKAYHISMIFTFET